MGKGDFLLHLGPERHELLRKAAEAEGISMAQYLTQGFEMRLSAGRPGLESLTAALRLVEMAARRMLDEPLLVPLDAVNAPPDEHKQDRWDKLMSDG